MFFSFFFVFGFVSDSPVCRAVLPSPMHYSTMRPQAPVHDPKKDELRHAPWYWGNITREEAKNVLLGKPDGSFLVRDAQTKVSKKNKKEK